MRFGICASIDEAPLLDEANVDFLEESVQRYLCPERPRSEFLEQLARASRQPLPVEAANGLLPPDLVLVTSPTRPIDAERLRRYMRSALERAAEAGIAVIVFGSGTARACPPDVTPADAVSQIGEHLSAWCEWARPLGITIALEPLRYEETNTLNTVEEGGRLVTSIAASGARLLADLYHMACNGEAPDTLLAWSPVLAHVHVAERRDRAAPGTHGEDFRPYFAALRRGGYDGRISIECGWQEIAIQSAGAIAAIRDQWIACGP